MSQNFSPTELEKRCAIIEACLEMNHLGINQGTSGNISVRHENYLLTKCLIFLHLFIKIMAL